MTLNTDAILGDFGWIAVDVITGLFFILLALLAARKGLYETFRPLLVLVLAVSCAVLLSAFVAPIATEIAWPKVEGLVSEEISSAIQNMDGSDAVFSPKTNKLLEMVGLDDTVDDIIREKAESAVDSVQADVMGSIKIAVEKCVHAVSFIIILLLGLLVFTLLSHVLKIAGGLPVLRQLNWIGGFGIGLLEAFLILFIAIKICAWKEISFFEDIAPGSHILPWVMRF